MPSTRRSRAARARVAATGEPYTLAHRRTDPADSYDPLADFDPDAHDQWLADNLGGIVYHVAAPDWAVEWSFGEGPGPELEAIVTDLIDGAGGVELDRRCSTLAGMVDELAARLADTLESDPRAQAYLCEYALAGCSDLSVVGDTFVEFLAGRAEPPTLAVAAVTVAAMSLRSGEYRDRLIGALRAYLADVSNAGGVVAADAAMARRGVARLPDETHPFNVAIATALAAQPDVPSEQLLKLISVLVIEHPMHHAALAADAQQHWTPADRRALDAVLDELTFAGYDIDDLCDSLAPLLTDSTAGQRG